MVGTNKFAKCQRLYTTMVKYCREKGETESTIRMKCVRCQSLYSIIEQYGSEKDKDKEQMK